MEVILRKSRVGFGQKMGVVLDKPWEGFGMFEPLLLENWEGLGRDLGS